MATVEIESVLGARPGDPNVRKFFSEAGELLARIPHLPNETAKEVISDERLEIVAIRQALDRYDSALEDLTPRR